jgi:hypothetical protein
MVGWLVVCKGGKEAPKCKDLIESAPSICCFHLTWNPFNSSTPDNDDDDNNDTLHSLAPSLSIPSSRKIHNSGKEEVEKLSRFGMYEE